MNTQNSYLVLAYVVSLGMALNIKDIVVMILFPNGSASRDMSPFSSMESFPFSPSSSSPIFTNVSFDLLPDTTDLDVGMTSSLDDIPTVNPNAPALPVDPPTLELDISVPRRSTQVKALPSRLHDYHCYSAFATLHEPHSFREVHTNLFWQNAMFEELNALTKTHT
jgi:hypothetical protein